MKKKVLALVLAIVMLFSSTTLSASALDFNSASEPASKFLGKALGTVFTGLVTVLNAFMGENDKFVEADEYYYDNFYEGTGEFISEAKPGATWSLGQAEASLVPEDWQDEKYDLYLGGFISEQNFFTNDVREILDDMKVRVIAMDDGSGRGTSVFATIDSIGIANGDARIIRAMLSDFAKKNNISSINIFSTHTHSGIDTQGLWTEIFRKWPKNIFSAFTRIGETEQGTDPEYMDFLYNTVSAAIKTAVDDMEAGMMTYAQKDIGAEYFNNKNRPSADGLDTSLRRLAFYPANKSSRPTIILNMSSHPDVVGLATDSDPVKGHGVSGDYIYYIGQALNGAGYDFMFFNGAIAGIYIGRVDVEDPRRVDTADNYGTEIGKMVLGMTKTEEEIKADKYLMSLNFTEEQTAGHNYTPWYEGWVPAKEETVEPILNLKLKTVEIPVTNPVIKAAGKLGVVNYTIKCSGKLLRNYELTTEIGYMEIGNNMQIAFVPGEFCADLWNGGTSLTAEGSMSGEAFTGKTITEIFGEDTVVFGLANDAIGYIVPDNDYCMCLAFGHYHETLSLGKKTASTIMSAFEELAAELK